MSHTQVLLARMNSLSTIPPIINGSAKTEITAPAPFAVLLVPPTSSSDCLCFYSISYLISINSHGQVILCFCLPIPPYKYTPDPTFDIRATLRTAP